MSMTIDNNMNPNYVNGWTGIEPQIINVKTGEGFNRAGFLVTVSGAGTTANVEEPLTPSQEADLEALLAILGLDGENAKTATMQTILQAIQAAIKQQAISVTTCTTAISDYDVTRLKALRKAMEGSDDVNAQKIIANVDRMMELKEKIEYLANKEGMVYDGKPTDRMGTTDTSSPNFELNDAVREMGDRIADIRHYTGKMGGDKMNDLLKSLAPAMRNAVKDLLESYDKTKDWGAKVVISYSTMSADTYSSFADFIASSDLKFPPQVSEDALLQILKEISEELSPNLTAELIVERLEEKMEEIVDQLQNFDFPIPV